MIAKQLHDYDNGYTYGLGVTLNKKVVGGAGGDKKGEAGGDQKVNSNPQDSQYNSQNNKNNNNTETGKLKYGVTMPVVVKFSEAQRDILIKKVAR